MEFSLESIAQDVNARNCLYLHARFKEYSGGLGPFFKRSGAVFAKRFLSEIVHESKQEYAPDAIISMRPQPTILYKSRVTYKKVEEEAYYEVHALLGGPSDFLKTCISLAQQNKHTVDCTASIVNHMRYRFMVRDEDKTRLLNATEELLWEVQDKECFAVVRESRPELLLSGLAYTYHCQIEGDIQTIINIRNDLPYLVEPKGFIFPDFQFKEDAPEYNDIPQILASTKFTQVVEGPKASQ